MEFRLRLMGPVLMDERFGLELRFSSERLCAQSRAVRNWANMHLAKLAQNLCTLLETLIWCSVEFGHSCQR